MSEEYGPEFITVTDEDGNDIEDVDEESDDYGLVILKSVQEDGEELLSTLDSEEELTEVYELFMAELFEDEEE